MLLVFLLLFLLYTEAFENHCDYVVLLQKGERKILPDYPYEETASACRWNVIAEPNRRIVFACISSKLPNPTDTEINHCNSNFSVIPEGESQTTYCRDKTFARVGNSNRMMIVSQTKKGIKFPNDDLHGVECYLYSEVKYLIIEDENLVVGGINVEECDYNITLGRKDLVRLDNPKHVEEEPGWSACRWTVVAPRDEKIALACPFTDKPPDPLSIQMMPCVGIFSVKTSTETLSFHCRQKAFSITSPDNEMVILYASPLSKRYEDYQCYLYVPSPPDSKVTTKSPFSKCDKFISIWFGEVQTLDSPGSPHLIHPKSSCRWTVVSPPDTRIALNCLTPGKGNDSAPWVNDNMIGRECDHMFNITVAGDKTTQYCPDHGFFKLSSTNQMIVTYRNPSKVNYQHPFKCYLSAEAKLTDCKNCTALEVYKNCNKTINITNLGQLEVLTLDPSTSCLWTIHFPKNSIANVFCPIDGRINDRGGCRTHLTFYPSGKFDEEQMHCLDEEINLFSNDTDTIFFTYSGLERRRPFACYASAYIKKCDIHEEFTAEDYTKHKEINFPYWPGSEAPWPECDWILTAPPKYQIHLRCTEEYKLPIDKLCRNFLISPSGQIDSPDAVHYCHGHEFYKISVNNTMSMNLELHSTAGLSSKPIGCNVLLQKKSDEDLCQCGQSKVHSKDTNNRIAEGKYSIPDEFPMMAALVNLKKNRKLFCGATVISQRYLLTAAYCVDEAKDNYFNKVGVVVGLRDITSEDNQFIYYADKLIRHPDYDVRPHVNDVGLVHVNDTIEFNDHVAPACLPFFDRENRAYFDKKRAFALGWGQKTEPDSKYLLKMEGYLQEAYDCAYILTEWSADQHICLRHSSEYICSSDSGGPVLFLDPKNNRLKVVGILYSTIICEAPYHTKAMDVIHLLDWIEENTKGTQFCKSF